MNDIQQRLQAAFRIEAAEHLAYLRSALEEGTSPSGTGLDEVFRRVHSLKGAARAVDLRQAEARAHQLENLFAEARENGKGLDAESIDLVIRGLDEIEDLVEMMAAVPETTIPPLPKQINRPADEGKASTITEDASQKPQTRKEVASIDSSEPIPKNSDAANPEAASAPADQVRVRIASLDRLLDTSGELLAERMHQDGLAHQMAALVDRAAMLEADWKQMKKCCARLLKEVPPSTNARTLDAHLQAVDRHVSAGAADVRACRTLQRQGAWNLQRLGQQLQTCIRQTRMVSAESLYGGFRKMVRDLARGEGKEVRFQVRGLLEEADRMVLQTLKDPLMHLLRNAVNHGIERPEERQRQNKPRTGNIELRVDKQGNQLAISVRDDGRGIDQGRVAAKARQRGLLAPDSRPTLTSQETTGYILQPGFSTAEGAGDLSGRGMGLSVVEQAVAHLQGQIEVLQPESGGTLVEICVPLSVATHRLLMVRLQGQHFGLPAHGVERLHQPDGNAARRVEGRAMIELGGTLLPLADLGRLLGMERETPVGEGPVSLVVLRSGRHRLAVIVDAFGSVFDGLVQRIALPVDRPDRIGGAVLLENGEAAIVLNPFALIDACQGQDAIQAVSVKTEVADKTPPTILVVDDSFTTRTLEKNILEAHGYRVSLAVDGVDALEQLAREQINLVVSDIEMPRLDGLGLVTQIKNDRRFAEIPVILVSSLERSDQRQKGMEAGAEAYIVKQRFDQHDLLEAIGRFI